MFEEKDSLDFWGLFPKKSNLELKPVESMPGSINELISNKQKFKRPPSLSESFAFSPENIARANQIPLIPSSEKLYELSDDCNLIPIEPTQDISEIQSSSCCKYEIKAVEITIKLLLHLTLISVFETLFYFLYVSSLENNGIQKTVNTFINEVVTSCEDLSPFQIEIVNGFLGQYINSTQVIAIGNQQELIRASYNKSISNRAWAYVGGLSGLFVVAVGYIRWRKIKIYWKQVVLENVAMVLLLALYELMFFDTIIYPYEPISTAEIERNAVEMLQGACGVL
jgi:hypothetical protein